MRRRALLPGLLLLPGLARAQVPGAGSAPAPQPLPPLPHVALTRGITLIEPGAWRVEFPSGSEMLEAPQRIVLGRIGAILQAGSVGRVTLISEVGDGSDLSATRRLSLARARAVKAALVAGGLSERRIDIRAMGQAAARRDTVDVLGPLVAKP